MPVFLATFIARIPERYRQAIVIIGALMLLVIGGGLVAWGADRWINKQKEQAVQIDRNDISREAAERVLAADRAATANQAKDDKAFADAQREVQHEVETKANDRPAGPGTAAVMRRVREQQAAGRR